MKQALLIFTKNLTDGKVKTRLAATIGNVAALSVYVQLLRHTARITRDINVEKKVLYSDYVAIADIWDEEIYSKAVQEGTDLGDRMHNAIHDAFGQGNTAVAVIGSDCIDLTEEIISESFRKLEEFDIVIGPAEDGGYYLIAMKNENEALFRNMIWSASEVLSQTISKCNDLNLSVFCLPQLSDIDTEADLIKVSERLYYSKDADD